MAADTVSRPTDFAGTPLRGSPSCERNVEPVGRVLTDWSCGRRSLLEVGSGTGQHAAGLIGRMPGLVWQPTDVQPDSVTIGGWAHASGAPDRINEPLALDVTDDTQWQTLPAFDVCFTANTLHIMPIEAGVQLFAQAARYAMPDAVLLIYGPFHCDGEATSEGNARFDAALRAEAQHMGIRDIEWARASAARNDWLECAHYHMPANNQMLVFRLSPVVS
ncbi:MAG: DUF938 domain-containing protein [Pseudomonadota bacterium]